MTIPLLQYEDRVRHRQCLNCDDRAMWGALTCTNTTECLLAEARLPPSVHRHLSLVLAETERQWERRLRRSHWQHILGDAVALFFVMLLLGLGICYALERWFF